jgi:hypothetical protein
MASLEKSRNSLQTGAGAEPLFMLRCDRSPVMLTCFRQLTLPDRPSLQAEGVQSVEVRTYINHPVRDGGPGLDTIAETAAPQLSAGTGA